MIKRLRIKFIVINMTIVTVMLGVIFGLVINFTRSNLEKESLSLLEGYSHSPGHPGRPDMNFLRGAPCFTLRLSDSGELIGVFGSDFYDLTDTELLGELASECYGDDSPHGVLRDYNLRYIKNRAPMGNEISLVFTDISREVSTMNGLVKSCILIGLASFILFLLISIFLAYRSTRPLKEAWDRQRQFIADASHELKTPLTVITTNAELLSSPEYPDEKRMGFTSNILAMSRQMRGLVEDLLDLAKLDSGKQSVVKEEFDMSRAVYAAALPFDAVFFEKGLSFDSDIESNITLKGNESTLCRVVDILLDNAAKYSSPGGRVTLSLKSTPRGSVTLTVINDGEEITKEERENIFKRFYRGDKVRSMKCSYGLGLSIAESAVKEHGGIISVKSENGRNIFTVTLPK